MANVKNLLRWAKRQDWDNVISVEHRAKKMGYQVLGSGAYGLAVRNGHEVVKIFNANDIGYRSFLDICLAYEGDYLPRIFWVRPISKRHIAVGMEVLRPIEGKYTKKEFNLFRQMMEQEDVEGDEEMVETADLLHNQMTGVNSLLMDEDNAYDYEGIALDLHYGNAMRRGEQLVIIDPFCA